MTLRRVEDYQHYDALGLAEALHRAVQHVRAPSHRDGTLRDMASLLEADVVVVGYDHTHSVRQSTRLLTAQDGTELARAETTSGPLLRARQLLRRAPHAVRWTWDVTDHAGARLFTVDKPAYAIGRGERPAVWWADGSFAGTVVSKLLRTTTLEGPNVSASGKQWSGLGAMPVDPTPPTETHSISSGGVEVATISNWFAMGTRQQLLQLWFSPTAHRDLRALTIAWALHLTTR